MNFLGVGPLELIVILLVALLVVGPERLPRLAADLARTIREIRKYTGSLAAEFNEVVKDLEKETEGERSQWKEIGEGLTGATQSVTDAVRAARVDAEAASAPAATSPASATDSGAPGSAAPAVKQTAAANANGTAEPGTWIDIEPPQAADDAASAAPNGATAPAPAEPAR